MRTQPTRIQKINQPVLNRRERTSIASGGWYQRSPNPWRWYQTTHASSSSKVATANKPSATISPSGLLRTLPVCAPQFDGLPDEDGRVEPDQIGEVCRPGASEKAECGTRSTPSLVDHVAHRLPEDCDDEVPGSLGLELRFPFCLPVKLGWIA